MIFRQLFDAKSSTYTYLLADDKSREALLIDPVLEQLDRYVQLLHELDLKLVYAWIPMCTPTILPRWGPCARPPLAPP